LLLQILLSRPRLWASHSRSLELDELLSPVRVLQAEFLMDLPGFRFHPTEEELVGFYLEKKIQGSHWFRQGNSQRAASMHRSEEISRVL